MHYRHMERQDLTAVVNIHHDAFKGFFLTKMGRGFLRTYYETVLAFEASIALVAYDTDTGEVLGFVVGFYDPEGFYSAFANKRRSVLPNIALAVLRDPRLIPQILQNRTRVVSQAVGDGSSPATLDTVVELSSIAVRTHGGGVGGVLLEAFLNEVRAHGGGAHVALTTDAHDNDSVRGFYERHHFVLAGYEMRGTRALCNYVRDLT